MEILLSFHRLKEQGLSASEIAYTMNSRGLEPPGGGIWTEAVVTRIDDLIKPQEDALRHPSVLAARQGQERSALLPPSAVSDHHDRTGGDPPPDQRSESGWKGPKGVGVALLVLTAIVATAFGLVALNERQASEEVASTASAIEGGNDAADPSSARSTGQPTETEDAPDPADMMSIQVEPEPRGREDADREGSADVIEPATATVKADGLLYLEGAFPSQTEADGYVEGLAKVFGRDNIVESYAIIPDAPLPSVSDVSLDKPVLFETGTATIDPSYVPFLEACGDVLKLNPQITMSIAAFTDSTGDEQLNLELSQRRARAIFDFYRSIEIDDSQLLSIGYGEANPVADNSTAAGREQNRRAMLQLLDVMAEQTS